jgi:outer membrane biosynthesis protein TonB
VSQSLPSIPSWAKALDTDAVVQLDALIDEKGNVAQTRPLSGPHVLQRVAEQAVALWIFEPALSDGKPTATHMVLTVQFQR